GFLDSFNLDGVVELGGPIIKNRMWFYVGLEAALFIDKQRRTVSALVDNCTQTGEDLESRVGPCTGGPDGYQDVINGDPQTRELYHGFYTSQERSYTLNTKLNLDLTPSHALELVYIGIPTSSNGYGTGIGQMVRSGNHSGSHDASAQLALGFFDKKWQIHSNLTYHRECTQ